MCSWSKNLSLTERQAFETLAAALHKSLERRDPSPDGEVWAELSDHVRDIYRGCVQDVLRETDAIKHLI